MEPDCITEIIDRGYLGSVNVKEWMDIKSTRYILLSPYKTYVDERKLDNKVNVPREDVYVMAVMETKLKV